MEERGPTAPSNIDEECLKGCLTLMRKKRMGGRLRTGEKKRRLSGGGSPAHSLGDPTTEASPNLGAVTGGKRKGAFYPIKGERGRGFLVATTLL